MVGENRWDEKAGLRAGCGVRSQVIDVLNAQIKRRPAMKKVSTVATKQNRNNSQQKLTVGLDLLSIQICETVATKGELE